MISKLIVCPVLVLGITLAGCASQETDPTACALSGTSNVERLFVQVEQRLQNPACHYSWQTYRGRLLAAAKGSPGLENEARFARLLRKSIEGGVISKRQGQQMFSRYFDPEFYTVKAEARSSCSALGRKENIYTDMRRELELKREGMLEVLDDEPRFRQAQQHYSDLRLVFDAVEMACNEA